MKKQLKILLLIVSILFLPTITLAEYIDIKGKALTNCETFNKLRHTISDTRHTKNSDNIRLKKGYIYRIIEFRKDKNQLRIIIDYIKQGDVKHRWVDRSCLEFS